MKIMLSIREWIWKTIELWPTVYIIYPNLFQEKENVQVNLYSGPDLLELEEVSGMCTYMEEALYCR